MTQRLVKVFLCGVVATGTLSACSKSAETPAGKEPSKAAPAAAASEQANANTEGEALAKKILSTYDETIAEAAKLTSGKPEPAVLKPQLEQLLATCTLKMEKLNAEYRALKAKDMATFGQANSYMGQHRGKHVFAADTTLTPALKYYNLEKGDKETVELLTTKLAAAIDVAVRP